MFKVHKYYKCTIHNHIQLILQQIYFVFSTQLGIVYAVQYKYFLSFTLSKHISFHKKSLVYTVQCTMHMQYQYNQFFVKKSLWFLQFYSFCLHYKNIVCEQYTNIFFYFSFSEFFLICFQCKKVLSLFKISFVCNKNLKELKNNLIVSSFIKKCNLFQYNQ